MRNPNNNRNALSALKKTLAGRLQQALSEECDARLDGESNIYLRNQQMQSEHPIIRLILAISGNNSNELHIQFNLFTKKGMTNLSRRLQEFNWTLGKNWEIVFSKKEDNRSGNAVVLIPYIHWGNLDETSANTLNPLISDVVDKYRNLNDQFIAAKAYDEDDLRQLRVTPAQSPVPPCATTDAPDPPSTFEEMKTLRQNCQRPHQWSEKFLGIL